VQYTLGKSNEVISPMQRLNLPSKGVASTSQESSLVGKRSDFMVFDDFISNKSSDTEIQRESSKNYFNAAAKLRTVEGYILTIGTPWHESDAYAAIIESNRKSNNWKIKIDPAWTPKDHARNKKVTELKEEDVTLLFPEHLSWKFLQSELAMNEAFFLSQNLMRFPKEANWDLKVQFSEDVLNRQTRFRSFFDTTIYKTYMALDRAYSTSMYADFSAIVTGRVQLVEKVQSLVVTDVFVERLKPAELANAVAKKINEHHPEILFFEKDRGYEELVSAIQQSLFTQFRWQRQDMPALKVVDILAGDRAKNSKAIRIKRLELPLEQRTLWFTAGQNWNDALISQMTKYQGKKSTSSSKDDMVDALSLLYDQVMPKNYYSPQEEVGSAKDREAEAERVKAKAMHERMFSSPMAPQQPSFADLQKPQPPRQGMDINGARKDMINRMLDNARRGKF
jgi:Terminase RNaseH-like domain